MSVHSVALSQLTGYPACVTELHVSISDILIIQVAYAGQKVPETEHNSCQ
jgi:hypothetical protein